MKALEKYTKEEPEPDAEPTDAVHGFIEYLEYKIVQFRIWHLQTLNEAEHKLTQVLYETLADMSDLLAETWQGVNGKKVSTYSSFPSFVNYKEGQLAISLKYCAIELDKTRSSAENLALKAILDDMEVLLNKSIDATTRK